MTPHTQSLHHRIDRVLARLQLAVQAGGELPDLHELAAVAHLSAYHFHRVYRALTGETVGRSVARLRLLRALHLLGEASRPITEVALAVGYDTPQAFSRAFRDAFGDAPSTLRERPERLAAEIERLSRPPGAAATAGAPLRVDVLSVEPFQVVALRISPADYEAVDAGYGDLFGWAASAGVVENASSLYGIASADFRDTPLPETAFECALGIDVAVDPPAPLRVQRWGGGDYARYRHVGPFRGIEDAVDRVLAEWLPDSGYVLRDAPIHRGFLDDPEHVPEALLRTDVYLPVQRTVEAGA
ncbi:MAG: AraC family transcriptional regulator [Luteimonas sp.]|nr:AraC family transcriptional regulator [Luteimonas sp.]